MDDIIENAKVIEHDVQEIESKCSQIIVIQCIKLSRHL